MRAEKLIDQDACRLMEAVRFGFKYQGRTVGEAFRTSCAFYDRAFHSGERSLWDPPPRRHLLEVDKFLLDLMANARPPRIAQYRAENPSALTAFGPFFLTRMKLRKALRTTIDPAEEQAHAASADVLIKAADVAAEALNQFVDWPWWSIAPRLAADENVKRLELASWRAQDFDGFTSVEREVIGYQERLEEALGVLALMKQLILQDKAIARVKEPGVGASPILWKREFVRSMAHLWRLLTLEDPTSSEGTHFERFVYEAWRSLDDEMPEVSFARAIRERT